MDIAGILGGRGGDINVCRHGSGRLEVGWWRAGIFGERDHSEAHPSAYVTADNGMATIDDHASNFGEVDSATGIA